MIMAGIIVSRFIYHVILVFPMEKLMVYFLSIRRKNKHFIAGREEGQLWYPRKVAVMRNSGKYIVCDRGNERSRMQIFTKLGHFVKKIAIRYIDIVAGLAITQQGKNY